MPNGVLQTLVPEAGDRSHNTCPDGVAPGTACSADQDYTTNSRVFNPVSVSNSSVGPLSLNVSVG